MNWPNRLSILRVALIPVVVLCLYLNANWASPTALAVFCVACLTDWLDGWLARKYHIITNFGKFLDPVADKLLVLSTLIALCGLGTLPAWACVVILFREIAVDGLRLVAVEQGVVIAAGQLGKIKTTLQMLTVVGYLALGCGLIRIAWLPEVLLYASVMMTLWSGVDYFVRNRGVLSGGEGKRTNG